MFKYFIVLSLLFIFPTFADEAADKAAKDYRYIPRMENSMRIKARVDELRIDFKLM